jgi:hypothetical protein
MREAGQAAAIATEVVNLAGNLKSRRYLRYIRDLWTDLRSYAEEPDVQEFRKLLLERYPAILTS